ncbi:MAG: hypothetical protein OXP09_08010 [Gammaproteobacteria bacterium]|nr:hypothetical protein [Gammaproteobacteria bacterium]
MEQGFNSMAMRKADLAAMRQHGEARRAQRRKLRIEAESAQA